ncbi:uncharacterized protein FTOL_08635 [Fusarium torulosum]|uniref:Uncharacterized protein n=1 Tax=Fusarium torulosum TaxID=33205 RepID=A0AAE8SK55_9HYPO|nr:uncharacterized protein FTOL_08635 [Fusarium torulosum]
MFGAIVDYGVEYGQSCCQQTQRSGGYGSTPAIMYNGPQIWIHNLIYGTRRQTAAMHTMTPDVTSSHFGSEIGNSGGSGTQRLAHGSSGFTYIYEPSHAINDYASNSISNVSAVPQATVSPEVSVGHHEDGEGGLDEKWVSYKRLLGSIFQDIIDASLESASETLLKVTQWLLSQVSDLGLNVDDINLHADRIQLWNDFNHAWLGLGQQQIDLMFANQQLSRSQSLVSENMVKKMGEELVRLCDGIERHGLVDYQFGVWEDQITAVLEDILDLYETWEEVTESDGQ